MIFLRREWAMVLAAAIATLVGGWASAQTSAIGRTTAATATVPLAHATPAWRWIQSAGAALQDLGEAPGDVSTFGSHTQRQLSLYLKRSAASQQAFDQLTADQQDMRSPRYHHWLSADEIGKQFGASDEQVGRVVAWLTAQGAGEINVDTQRLRVSFAASNDVLQAAFGIREHDFAVTTADGARGVRRASVGQATLPADLADDVAALAGDSDIPVHATSHARRVTGASMRGAVVVAPQMTIGPTEHFVTPVDFSTIYDLGSSTNGAGQSVAIIAQQTPYTADITHFESLLGINASGALQLVAASGGAAPAPLYTTDCASSTSGSSSSANNGCGSGYNDQFEATLDVERVIATAPGANVTVVVSQPTGSEGNLSNLFDDMNYVDGQSQYAIVSMSYSACEADLGDSGVQQVASMFQSFVAEGRSVFISSGDAGVSGCVGIDSAGSATYDAITTNGLCSSAYVTCVGGTEFNDASATTYWSSENGSGFGSATGYIPEGAWNESAQSGGGAGGGGLSSYVTAPSWQAALNFTWRATPDVSFTSASHDGYFACMIAGGGACTVDSSNQFGFIAASGTSAAAPSMAGIAARLNQSQGSAQGNLNPRLYALAQSYPTSFHDITVASSGVASCTSVQPSMCNNTYQDSDGIFVGNLVQTGYDEATGLGSIDVVQLLSHWAAAPAAFNLDQVGLTGTWYNPATGGQGLLVNVYKDINGAGQGLFGAGWFTYDYAANGTNAPRWFVVTGPAIVGATSIPVTIDSSSGNGVLNAAPVVSSTPVGTGVITFSSCTEGSFSFSMNNGTSGTIPLLRLDANVSCTTAGDSATIPSNYLLSGTWYNPAIGGQGWFLDFNPVQNGGSLIAAWYTFLPADVTSGGSPNQQWALIQDLSGDWAQGSVVAGFSGNTQSLLQTSGGVFNQASSLSTSSATGTSKVTVQDCTHITITYSFTSGVNAGQSGTQDLVRLGPTPTGCSL